MRYRRGFTLAITVSSLLSAVPTRAFAIQRQGGLRVGLVLSGGAAKGLAHVGVLEGLETLGVPVHYITGNSIGGLVGALYAMGYEAKGVEDILASADWSVLSSDAVPRRSRTFQRKQQDGQHLLTLPLRGGLPRLPRDLLDGQRLWQLLARMTWPVREIRDFRTLPIPFASVATDIETGEAVVLDHGDLADVLRATMSVPGLFAPVHIDGRWLIDGMLVRNLPAREALDLGADILICSDVSEPLMPHDSLASVVDVLDQITSFRGMEALREDRARCDILLEPNTNGLRPLSFTRIPDWADRGRRAVEAAAPELLRLRNLAAPAEVRPLSRRDSVRVDTLEIAPPTRVSAKAIRRGLGLHVPRSLSVDYIDKAINRVYGTGYYKTLTYAFRPGSSRNGRTLIIRPDDSVQPMFGFGMRYESRNKASFLVSTNFDHLLAEGSRTEIDLRLGRPLQLAAHHNISTGPSDRLSFRIGAGVTRLPFDAFVGDRVVATTSVDVWHWGTFAGVGIGRIGVTGIEVMGQYVRQRQIVPEADVGPDRGFGTLSGVVAIDTRDREVFPQSGLKIDARGEWARQGVGSRSTFSQLISRAQLHVPITSALSLNGDAVLGRSSGSDLPPNYIFHLGGSAPDYVRPMRQFPFFGLAPQEMAGSNVQVFGLGWQYAIGEYVITRGYWNAGNTMDVWEFRPEDFVHGVGLTVGARAVVGYLAVTFAGRDFFRQPRVEIDLGSPF